MCGWLLMYSVYLNNDQETSFLMTKEGGSCGNLHISVYYFTLERSFTVLTPQDFFKKSSVSRDLEE